MPANWCCGWMTIFPPPLLSPPAAGVRGWQISSPVIPVTIPQRMPTLVNSGVSASMKEPMLEAMSNATSSLFKV